MRQERQTKNKTKTSYSNSSLKLWLNR